jgi:hypothetical protein
VAGAFGYTSMPARVAPQASAVGRALLQRKEAMQPQNAQPGMPQLVGNTAQGQLPQIGKRLLQASPQNMPTPSGQQYGGGF